MGRLSLGGQRGALRYAEAVLLVGHDRAQPMKVDALLDERVRTDDNLRRTALDGGEGSALLRGIH